MILIKAIPGSGKNMIASLVCRHYNIPCVSYHDNLRNQCHHSPYIGSKKDGKIIQPFWNGNQWDFIFADPVNTKILHEHSWRRIPEFTTEVYYVYCDKPEEFTFLKKLICIKRNGIKPFITFTDNYSSLDLEDLGQLGSISKNSSIKLKNLLNLSTNKLTYKQWITVWKNFCRFINNFPYLIPLSIDCISYLTIWLNEDMSWDLYDRDMFLIFHKNQHNENLIRINLNNVNVDTEIQELKQARKYCKDNNIILNEINYSDLFFNKKKTNTILDYYEKDIKEYTESNLLTIKNYEDIYGELLNINEKK